MNKIGMKKDTIKKLLLVGLLVLGTGSISGCSSKKKGDANQQTSTNSIEVMSAMETKKLLEGDQIDKIPDLKTLESMALSYEIVYEDTKMVNEKEEKPILLSLIEQYASDFKKTYEKDYEEKGNKVHDVAKYLYVHIIPIDGFYMNKDDDNKWTKFCYMRNGMLWSSYIKYNENLEILKAKFGRDDKGELVSQASVKKGPNELASMSAEETKTLKEGDKVDKVPDAKILESMGLCYEVEYEETKTVYKEKPETYTTSEVIGSNTVKKTYEKNHLINGESVQSVYKYKQGYIIAVNNVSISKDVSVDPVWVKHVLLRDGMYYEKQILFEENIEILKAMFKVTE
ncbi:MAG: hypothetical protein RSC10_09980 [Longicatena sp.]